MSREIHQIHHQDKKITKCCTKKPNINEGVYLFLFSFFCGLLVTHIHTHLTLQKE